MSHLKVVRLRTEYLKNPLCIATDRPRLSWQLLGDEDGAHQTAYQIQGSSKRSFEEADLWDTGRTESDQTIQIPYEGKKVEPGQRAWWRARVWDEKGEVSDWSAVHSWQKSPDLAHWPAKWIAHPEPEEGRPARFSKTVQVPKNAVAATLYATARGVFTVRANGQPIYDDALSPGWTDYTKRIHVVAYDLTNLLDFGEFMLEIELADGWYAGHLAFTGKRAYYGETPSLSAWIRFETQDGDEMIEATGPDWQVTHTCILSADLLMGCDIDTRIEPEVGVRPTIVEPPTASLVAHPGGLVRRLKLATDVKRIRDTVFDLGQNFAGFIRFRATAEAGSKIIVRHAERLNEDGTLYVDNLRKAKATDTYIAKGGRQTFEPDFTFHGFQYVEITGTSQEVEAEDIEGIVLYTEMGRTLEFKSSHPLLDRLVLNSDWSFIGNAIDIPTDCPQRDERAGWTGDAQVFAKTAMLQRDCAALFTKWLADLCEDGQREDGAFADIAPYVGVVSYGNAAWEDAGVICTYRMWEMYGDRRVIEQHWAAMERFMDHLRDSSDDWIRPAGSYGDWLLLDEPMRSSVTATAYTIYCARLMSQMAGVLGLAEAKAKYQSVAREALAAWRAKFVSAEGEILDDGKSSQTFYALAIAWDLLDKEQEGFAAVHLQEKIEAQGLATGFIGTPVLLFALEKVGLRELANRLVLNESYPSWLYQIKLGATSMWERWDGWTPEKGFQDPGMNSFNHYWLGCVAEWIVTRMVGIDTAGDAFKRIRIAPQIPAGLEHASATYHSIRGPIRVAWDKRVGKIEVTIPPNTTGEVVLGGNVTQVDSGRYEFDI